MLKYVLMVVLAVCTFGISLLVQLIMMLNNKKKARLEEERLKEQALFNQGYKKIYKGLYINEDNKCMMINDVKYGFSQIVDCELIQNEVSIDNSYSKTRGKLKDNGKIKARTQTYTTSTDYCKQLYVNVVVDNFENPNVHVDLMEKRTLSTKSMKYQEKIQKAEEIISLLKLIIAKNKEKYVENGTVTKIEHHYVEAKSNEERIQELAKLYKDGVLTEYEFSIKKQELLQ